MRSILPILLLMSSFMVQTNAFSVQPRVVIPRSLSQTILFAEENENSSKGESITGRKRRVRRKTADGSTDDIQAQSTKAFDFQPREDSGVSLKVTDVRDLVSGRSTTIEQSSSSITNSPKSVNSSSNQSTTTSNVASSKPFDDSLQQLLLDAREMQDKSPTTKNTGNDDGGMSAKMRNAISTLVTIDFFVVCLFLLWFLAGIFCSTVLKDDTVQIAFNSNFQQLVQPALGILMIAAIADAVFKQKDTDDESTN